MQPVTFAGKTAKNHVEDSLLDKAREAFRDAVREYINEGDVAIILADFDGDALEEELERIMTDTAERTHAAADPGRSGYSMQDITFDLDDVYYWAKEEMEARIERVRSEQNDAQSPIY